LGPVVERSAAATTRTRVGGSAAPSGGTEAVDDTLRRPVEVVS